MTNTIVLGEYETRIVLVINFLWCKNKHFRDSDFHPVGIEASLLRVDS
jgi:hypothetical protein